MTENSNFFYDTTEVSALLSKHRCNMCGQCCTWPGSVYLCSNDIDIISQKLNLTKVEFVVKYAVIVECNYATQALRLALKKKSDGQCCFLRNENVCRIHENKPLVCFVGAAGWHWVTNRKNMIFYQKNSESFNNEPSNNLLSENLKKFYTSLEAESSIPAIRDLTSLASYHRIDVSVLEKLDVVQP